MGKRKEHQSGDRVAYGLAVFLMIYVVSYIGLTRWSMYAWGAKYGLMGCFLLPVDPCDIALSPAMETCEYGLRMLYYPLNWIDYALTGTSYGGLPLMRLV